MYNGALLPPELGEFDPNNGDMINALSGAQPLFSGPNPRTTALMSAISGQAPSPPQPAPDTGGWPVLDAMSGYGGTEPTPAPPGGRLWGTLTPNQALSEVSSGLPALRKGVAARQSEFEQARARPPEAPALSYMGMPLVSAREAKESAERELEAAQAKKAHAEAQLAGEAALPTTTPLRNAAESAFQAAGTSYASVPRLAGYIGGWLANEAGADIHPADNAVFNLGDQADKWAKSAFPGDQARADEFGTKAAHLTGFLATLYGAGGVKAMTAGGPELAAKIGNAVAKGSQASLAVGTGGMGQFEAATAAMEAGKGVHPMAGVTITPQGVPVSERDRAMATMLGAGIGLTSLIPAASATATAGEREIGAIMAKALEGSGVNASQMAAFNVLNNAIAREIYDPTRSLTQGINEDIALGALAGGVTHGTAAATGPKRLSTPEEIQAFIDAARQHNTDPAKAAYWRNMRRWADDTLLLPAPGGAAPRAAPPAPIPTPAAPGAPTGEAPQEAEAPTPQEPVKLAEAGPYALRGRTDWREEAHGDRPPADRGEGAQNIGAGEEVGPPRGGGELPGEGRAAPAPRPVVGTETFGYRDKHGSPVAGTVNNERPAKGYTGRVVFRAYPEGTTIGRTESPQKKLGEPLARVTLNQHPDGSWEVGMMETHPEQGGRHLTGNMLDKVEERLGGKLKAPGTFWPDGYRLWSKRDPEAVQHHQEIDGEHLSPATLKRQIDKNQESIDAADPIRDWEYISDLQKDNKRLNEAFERVPEHARTPEALEGQFALRGVHSSSDEITRVDPAKFGSREDPGYYGSGFYMYPYEHAAEQGRNRPSGTFYGVPKEGAAPRNYLINVDAKNPFRIDDGKADWESLKPHGWEHGDVPAHVWGDEKAMAKARETAPQELKEAFSAASGARSAAQGDLYSLYDDSGRLKPGVPQDHADALAEKYKSAMAEEDAARAAMHPAKLLAKQFTKSVLDAGYDAIVVSTGGKPQEMVGIKPGTLSTTFGDDPMYALRGFYRPDIAAATDFPQGKATAGQWVAGLTKTPGAKRWLDLIGFEDWANQQKGSISRDDVLTFMRMHDVHVTERQLGEGGAEYKDIVDKLDKIKMERAQSPTDQRRREIGLQEQNLKKDLQKVRDKFGEYSIPGGENYREMLIDIPELKHQGWVSPHFKGQDVIHLRADDRTMPNGDLVFFLHELQSDLHQAGRKSGYRPDIDEIMAKKTDEYEKSHAEWEARQEEWKPLKRKFTRFIDSLSGKLYRDGRWLDLSEKSRETNSRIGHMDPSSHEDVKWVVQHGDTIPSAFSPYYDVVKSLSTQEELGVHQDLANREIHNEADVEPIRPDRDRVLEEMEGIPPEAPFKGNWWSELGAKYLIQRAVADGYDAFALPRADQIEPRVRAAPGSLKKFYDENLPKFVEKYVKTLGGKVEEVPSRDLNDLSELKTKKQLVGEALSGLRRDPRDLSLSDLREVNTAIRYFNADNLEDILSNLPEQVRDRVLKDVEEIGRPKTNKIVRITQEMAEKVLGRGQAMALVPERAVKMMKTALDSGKSVAVSRAAIDEVHDSIAQVRHIAPEDIGVHALAKIKPREDGRLTATFRDVSGNDLHLVADSLADLTNLRGFCLNDGANICIPNFFSSGGATKGGPAGGAEVRAPDPHGGVFVHEAVHSLLRRGGIPADDWSRFVNHANSLQVLDMPMHEYLGAIGEDVKPGPDTLRDNYKIAYQNYAKEDVRALLNEEEPVAHMMELFHHGHFKGDQMQPIADLLQKFVAGEYAKAAKAGGPAAPEGERQSLEAVQDELHGKIKALYGSEFPGKDLEDFGTHGWWALGEGKSSYGDRDVLNRIREKHPELVDKYRSAYKAGREARLRDILGEAAE